MNDAAHFDDRPPLESSSLSVETKNGHLNNERTTGLEPWSR